jgi:hypothetical protein
MARPRRQALNNRKRLRLKRAGTRTGGDRRFESPLLQVVAANRPRFLAPTIPRLFSALARKLNGLRAGGLGLFVHSGVAGGDHASKFLFSIEAVATAG